MKKIPCKIMFLLSFIFIFSCEKNNDVEVINKPDPLLSSNIVGKLNRNKGEIERKLNLITKSLVKLIDNPQFVELVAIEVQKKEVLNSHAVLLNKLKLKCDQVGHPLMAEAGNSAIACGASTSEIAELNQIFSSFELEGITFYPLIYFPYLNSRFYDHSGWDSKTPSMVINGMFNCGKNVVPAYSLDPIGNPVLSEISNAIDPTSKKWIVGIYADVDYLHEPVGQFFRINEMDCTCTNSRPGNPGAEGFCKVYAGGDYVCGKYNTHDCFCTIIDACLVVTP